MGVSGLGRAFHDNSDATANCIKDSTQRKQRFAQRNAKKEQGIFLGVSSAKTFAAFALKFWRAFLFKVRRLVAHRAKDDSLALE
jgi:hypothetical protein